MSSRAEKLLEGFKLGDLGAGKTRFADAQKPQAQTSTPVDVEPEEEPGTSFRILKEGEEKLDRCSIPSPYIFWEEGGSYKVAMFINCNVVKATGDTEYLIIFAGGPRLLFGTRPGVITFGSAWWDGYLRLARPVRKHFDLVKGYFEQLVSLLKKKKTLAWSNLKTQSFKLSSSDDVDYLDRYLRGDLTVIK